MARRIAIVCFVILAAGCSSELGGKTQSKQTICYPSFPVVSPRTAVRGTAVVVSSEGFRGCGSLRRLTSYSIQLHRGVLRLHGRDGPPVANVRVADDGSFETTVDVPASSKPGEYYILFRRAPGDTYTADCGSCGVASPNLTVLGA
jgi:hypothetical protein